MSDNIFKYTDLSPFAGSPESPDLPGIVLRYRQTDQLRMYIREGNEHAARQVMNERFREGRPGRLSDELTELKYDLVLLCGLMGQSLRESGIEDLHLERIHTSSLRRIESAASPDECRSLAPELAKDYCSLSRLQSFHNYPPLIKEIILAVDMDLARPLTLSYFAEMLNVNSSYLSGLFKKKTGISLTEYITTRRVLRAADLLLTSQLPIKTIAEQVGIADVHYFSRVFKKETGQTPRQYREHHVRNQEQSSGFAPSVPQK